MNAQRIRTTVAVFLSLIFVATARPVEADAKMAPNLKGRWIVTSAERNGKPDEDIKGHLLRFGKKKFTIRKGKKVLYQGTYRLDPSTKPASIDFMHTGGALKGKTWKGIYKLAGETLTICDNSADLEKPRPKTFETKAESGHLLVQLKRDK